MVASEFQVQSLKKLPREKKRLGQQLEFVELLVRVKIAKFVPERVGGVQRHSECFLAECSTKVIEDLVLELVQSNEE
jgi:hypothetical protein